MAKKKVLGISFGRKMANTDVMVKTALMECEKAGCDVQFIRADDLDIKPCTGCISCVMCGECNLLLMRLHRRDVSKPYVTVWDRPMM